MPRSEGATSTSSVLSLLVSATASGIRSAFREARRLPTYEPQPVRWPLPQSDLYSVIKTQDVMTGRMKRGSIRAALRPGWGHRCWSCAALLWRTAAHTGISG